MESVAVTYTSRWVLIDDGMQRADCLQTMEQGER